VKIVNSSVNEHKPTVSNQLPPYWKQKRNYFIHTKFMKIVMNVFIITKIFKIPTTKNAEY